MGPFQVIETWQTQLNVQELTEFTGKIIPAHHHYSAKFSAHNSPPLRVFKHVPARAHARTHACVRVRHIAPLCGGA